MKKPYANYTEYKWQDRVHKFCLNCMGGSNKGVADCQSKDCEWWPDRNGSPQQLSCFDEYRSEFYAAINTIVREITGQYTARDIKQIYNRKFNGDREPIHPGWWGASIKIASKKNGAKFLCTIKSGEKRRRGGYVGVWEK